MEKIQVFIEYKIIASCIQDYEEQMQVCFKELKQFGATEISWYESCEQSLLYVEMFKISKDKYPILKEMRKNVGHPIFGPVLHYIEGGQEKCHCWSFKEKQVNE